MKREIDTSSEAWRHECEVRHVLALRGINRNRALEYIALVKSKRGEVAGQELEAAVMKAWQSRGSKAYQVAG